MRFSDVGSTAEESMVCTDSPLEGAGFELLLPQINSPVLAPDATAGISLMFVFDAHLAKSGARQCYRSRAATPSAERPVSSRLNAWSCRRAFGLKAWACAFASCSPLK